MSDGDANIELDQHLLYHRRRVQISDLQFDNGRCHGVKFQSHKQGED